MFLPSLKHCAAALLEDYANLFPPQHQYNCSSNNLGDFANSVIPDEVLYSNSFITASSTQGILFLSWWPFSWWNLEEKVPEGLDNNTLFILQQTEIEQH